MGCEDAETPESEELRLREVRFFFAICHPKSLSKLDLMSVPATALTTRDRSSSDIAVLIGNRAQQTERM